MLSKDQHRSHELPWGIEITQFLYLIFSIFLTIAFLAGLIISKEINLSIWEVGLAVIIFWVLFYGTYKIRSWVVAPILIFSTLSAFWGFIEIVNFKPTNYVDLAKKTLLILWTIFFLFQLYIFSRTETKTFFQEKGKIIFS